MTPLSKNARVTGLLYILSSLFGLVRLVYIPSTLLASGSAAVMINSQDVNNGSECNRLVATIDPRHPSPNVSETSFHWPQAVRGSCLVAPEHSLAHPSRLAGKSS